MKFKTFLQSAIMMQGTILSLFLIIFLCCVSCKSNIPTATNSPAESNNIDWRKDKLFDPVWYDTIQSQKRIMLSSWLHDVNPIRDYSGPPYSEAYNLFTSQDDWKGTEIIPVEIYTLFAQDFRSSQIDSTIPFESILRLKKDKVEFYVVKNKKFFYNVSMSLNNNIWSFSGYGPIFKNFADTLSMLHFDKHAKIFRVYIQRAFDGHPFTVYKKCGKLFCLGYGGTSKDFYNELDNLLVR